MRRGIRWEVCGCCSRGEGGEDGTLPRFRACAAAERRPAADMGIARRALGVLGTLILLTGLASSGMTQNIIAYPTGLVPSSGTASVGRSETYSYPEIDLGQDGVLQSRPPFLSSLVLTVPWLTAPCLVQILWTRANSKRYRQVFSSASTTPSPSSPRSAVPGTVCGRPSVPWPSAPGWPTSPTVSMCQHKRRTQRSACTWASATTRPSTTPASPTASTSSAAPTAATSTCRPLRRSWASRTERRSISRRRAPPWPLATSKSTC